MCSVSWEFQTGGYRLGFNRDEKWNRPLSTPPRLERQHPCAGACARDAGGGGTWLFTNEHGITLAVMNAYPNGLIPRPGRFSRGQIPLLAAQHQTFPEIEAALFAYPWQDFAPCHVLVFTPDQMRHYTWNSLNFCPHPPAEQPFLTCSSVNSVTVQQAREARHRLISTRPIQEILSDTTAPDPASAIYVTREDAGTVSQTLVTVSADTIFFSVARRNEATVELHFPRKS
jgi:uncharacterized protein with NRDE domain